MRTRRGPEHLVVGLGASAGGLEALEEFFEELPSNPGMSFVVITHQTPGIVSLLPELIARRCKMPVVKVDRKRPIEPDHVYIQPPGATLGVLKGELFPFEPSGDAARRYPIDFFCRSLAQDQKDRAVGIVLSGTGSDGTNGLREIRAVSGLVMAQTEATARYPGMPHSASVALQLDFVLSPREMAQQLLQYRAGAARVEPIEGEGEAREVMNRLFVLLRSRTGQDFSNYKAKTIGRRIARRMSVHQLATMDDYLKYVQLNPHELDLLFKELLIGVTSFFRDGEGFDVFSKTAVPQVLANKTPDYVLRAWVAGCSTGEEAYTVAMLLQEQMDAVNVHCAAQIFASDLDADAIQFARAGVYPDSIATDVTPERLERFFVRENGYYRITKEVREMVVFAVQDLVEDPAFTKLDFLLCRNLLIYLDSQIQKRIIPLFHYALRPGGVLMLGSSETVGGFMHLFDTIDKKWKIFQRREVPAGTYTADVALGQAMDTSLRDLRNGLGTRRVEPGGTQLAERALLEHLVPPSVILHEDGEIVHIHGRTGLYLEPAVGSQAGANLYSMAREGLQLELKLAVRRASTTNDEILHRNVKVKTNGDFTQVNLRVRRLSHPEQLRGLYIVAFERAKEPEASTVLNLPPEERSTLRITDLEHELSQSKEVHEVTVGELATTNEELKSANEELQSMNEELQSANEELETSKEEMQSLNEELQTVNGELQGKVEELSRTNDDMKNLLNATDIGTLFLDNDLNIKRHTEQAKRVIRLIPSDVGRPIGDLVSNLRYSRLVEDAREVLRTLVFKEAEVESDDGSWYLMRILPYRTTKNVIDGLVITFVNVSNVRNLQLQTERILAALARSPSSVFGQNGDLKYEWAYGNVFGHSASETVGKTDQELLGKDDGERVMTIKRQAIEHGARTRTRLRFGGDGSAKNYDLYVEPVPGDGAGLVGVLTRVEESS
ncbi:MAG TPA: CheR family methyltransferase [Polyangiaceae bacterium]